MVKGCSSQRQATPLTETPHADAAGIDLSTAVQEVDAPHAVHVSPAVVVALPIGSMVDQPGAVLDLPFLQALALTPWVEGQGRIAILDQMQRQRQGATVARHFHDGRPSPRRRLAAWDGVPGPDAPSLKA